MSRFSYLILALVLAVAGCSKQAENSAKVAQKAQSEPDTSAHATGSVVPGSYEDWCGEHNVPETACTQCNPKLVAAFKATGDWCNEHGLPESQCMRCNPDLKIVRPPKPGSI